MKALGHDRTFRVPAKVSMQGADLEHAEVAAEINLTAVEIEGEISDRDRREILRRLAGDVLHTNRYGTAHLVSKLSDSFLRGNLALHGQDHLVELPVNIQADGKKAIAQGETQLDLARWGVKPYKALLGALRVNTVVTVFYRVEVNL